MHTIIKRYIAQTGRIYLWVLFFGILFSSLSSCANNENNEKNEDLDTLIAKVDEEISKSDIYQNEKEKQIERLKLQYERTKDNLAKIRIADTIIEEYESFISDSALYYTNLNLQNPLVINDKSKTNELLIKKADITAHAGLFNEAERILESINSSELDTALLQKYYYAYCDLYQYKIEYNNEGEYANETEALREAYIDSVTNISQPTSFVYVINEAASKTREGKTDEAEKMLKNKITEYKSGDRRFSILASILAHVYKTTGNLDMYRKYLALTVISDIQGSVKENMGVRALATEFYEDGDFERADRYLRKSFEDANFYAARMRNAQSSRILPVIGAAYVNQQKKMNHELRLFIIFISILAFCFILISIFAFIQVRKIRAINKKTKVMLNEVSELSDRLTKVNEELETANRQLQWSNKIKGEYGALFMEYSSMAISALHQYQQSLRVAAVQGNLQTLIKKIESANVENKTLAEFYNKFDEAILNIYPNYVSGLNALLKPGEKIEVPGVGLNTELRVFALIKIGISDSEKIAKFLRCSLSTVYTYRSKMKKRAIDPDNFENDLMQI